MIKIDVALGQSAEVVQHECHDRQYQYSLYAYWCTASSSFQSRCCVPLGEFTLLLAYTCAHLIDCPALKGDNRSSTQSTDFVSKNRSLKYHKTTEVVHLQLDVHHADRSYSVSRWLNLEAVQ